MGARPYRRDPVGGLTLLLGSLLALAGPLEAQEAEVRGRVLLGPDSVPLARAPVELHRIGRDTAGVVAAETADASGRFAFALPAADTGDLFLVTTRHDGVVYFGPPFHDPAGVPDPYRVVAHPARPLAEGAALSLSRRHLVITPEAGGLRVLDVAAAANDSSWTWTAPDGADAVWSLSYPESATGASVERGGVSPGEVRFGGGLARIRAAVPPGGQRLVLTYRLPAGQEVELPVERRMGVLELLIRPPARISAAEGLEEAGSVRFQGQEYWRYRARDPAPGTAVRFTPTTGGGGDGRAILPWLLVAGGVLLLAAAGWLRIRLRRRGPPG